MPDPLSILRASAEQVPNQVEDSAWELLVIIPGVAAALIAVLGGVWWLVKPRIEKWAREQIVAPLGDVHREVLVNGGRNNPPTMLDRIEANATEVRALRTDFRDHIQYAAGDSDAMWRAIEAVANASPPEDRDGGTEP